MSQYYSPEVHSALYSHNIYCPLGATFTKQCPQRNSLETQIVWLVASIKLSFIAEIYKRQMEKQKAADKILQTYPPPNEIIANTS